VVVLGKVGVGRAASVLLLLLLLIALVLLLNVYVSGRLLVIVLVSRSGLLVEG